MIKIARLVSVLILAVPAAAQLSGVDGKAQLIKVTDRVYCATGYALGNVIFVAMDKSVVVIDTTESMQSARRA
jgi:alkyl sulfatase BDS1-like metallo-beta-lactamase superfamily hydrolase